MAGTSRSVHAQAGFHADGGDDPRFIDNGEARVAYRTLGDGEPTVLVLQPFWSEMGDLLSDEGGLISQIASFCRVIMHDRRGTGASDRHPTRISMDAMLEDLGAVLTDAGVESAVVLGMGESAPLAVHFAAAWSDRVSQLILVDPTLRPLKGPGSAMLLHTLRGKPRAGLRALARTLVDNDDLAATMGAQMARTVDGPTAARLYETFLNADAVEQLPNVHVPALLAYGVYDRIVSEDEARMLHGKMPNARLSFVPGSAGGVMALEEARARILGFIDEFRSARRPTERPRLTPLPVEPAEPAPRRASPARAKSPLPAQRIAPIDFVPAGKPAAPKPPANVMPGSVIQTGMVPAGMIPAGLVPAQVTPSLVTSPGGGRHMMLTWGPPQDIPEEAVRLNRQGVDQILIGAIEEALNSFQQALEIAPHFEDAAVNHRELLSRLVQRRVAEWQNKQAEDAMAESQRRAEQWARRAGRGRIPGIRWIARPFLGGG